MRIYVGGPTLLRTNILDGIAICCEEGAGHRIPKSISLAPSVFRTGVDFTDVGIKIIPSN